MICYTNPVYKCSLLMFIIFNSFMATFTARISPCKVRNAIIQPQFGISANTKKMVDIIQIPPLIVQKITIGICLDNNRSFTDLTQPNSPNYICKQRYSAVEVYSKEEDTSKKSSISPIAPEQVKERLLQKLVKNFIIVEAGCDFSFNVLPIVGYQSRKDSESKEQIYSPEIVGVSSLYDEKATKYIPPSVTNVVEVAESLMGSKSSILSPRSMRTQRTHFFRNGGHLHSSYKSLELNSSNDNPSRNIGSTDLSKNHSTTNMSTEKESFHLQPQSTSVEVEGVTNKREDEQKVLEEEVEAPLDGEFLLNPSDIGLPILFLDSAMDPVMEIISRFSD
ncbi:unnamed protein product [Orchesella dallaii]|uniref:Uncharacterized protein n=1 Tax=Orchesella dallaii TaxID=48710 RepID=A0ABP1QG23_9HEXA